MIFFASIVPTVPESDYANTSLYDQPELFSLAMFYTGGHRKWHIDKAPQLNGLTRYCDIDNNLWINLTISVAEGIMFSQQ